MSREQYLWGLSNGVTVLSISGAFWLGLAAWTAGTAVLFITLVPILFLAGAGVAGSVRLRRRTLGFSPSSFRNASRDSPTRRIIARFYVITTVQWISIVLVGVMSTASHRIDLLWPLIGLIVSLHFLPLGSVFGVRAYYVAGAVGSTVDLLSIWALRGQTRLLVIGIGLGLTAGACAAYLIARADAIAEQALRHKFGRART